MQPCTPPRKITRWVNGHGVITVSDRHSHHSKQFDGQLSLSATNTCPHRSVDASMRRGRSLALDHGLVYLHSTSGQNHPLRLPNSCDRASRRGRFTVPSGCPVTRCWVMSSHVCQVGAVRRGTGCRGAPARRVRHHLKSASFASRRPDAASGIEAQSAARERAATRGSGIVGHPRFTVTSTE
jgi:hypothetical protein